MERRGEPETAPAPAQPRWMLEANRTLRTTPRLADDATPRAREDRRRSPGVQLRRPR